MDLWPRAMSRAGVARKIGELDDQAREPEPAQRGSDFVYAHAAVATLTILGKGRIEDALSSSPHRRASQEFTTPLLSVK
jgi:hypothetical protein